MTTPTHVDPVVGASPHMTPERWRAVDAILQAALACEPERRVAFIADACDGDFTLRVEVASLLAAHIDAGDDFLERPVAETLGASSGEVIAQRLTSALDGRYAIEREIARGGMATVYLARDLRHGRLVAIKVLRAEIAAAVGAERFLAEIRVTASLQHPHILPLFDSGSADGLLWYAMPYVEGETLRACLARAGPLPVADAVRFAREIADALDHAHARGIVHRDVKPENVLLQDGHALVADFGIALALEEAGGERITRTGLALGTPQYMAPEQAAGERALDARVDVYALGAVLHEMIAGEPPFAAPTRQAVVRRMMHELPPTLTTRRPDVAPFIDVAVRRALAKRPDDRFASAAAFAAALAVPISTSSGGFNSGSAALDSGQHATRRGRTVSARAALYAAGAMLLVGLVGGLLVDRSSFVRRWTDSAPADVLGRQLPPLRAQVSDVGDAPLAVVDRTGRVLRGISANRPWAPRFSPDGHSVAYGAVGSGRESSDIWVMNIDDGKTRRLTDDDGDSNDPQWSPDGKSIAYSVNAPDGKDVVVRPIAGGEVRVLLARPGLQFPNDWLRDGSALVVTDDGSGRQRDILVQPLNGSAPTPYVATDADETAARISPDGHWIAYTSDNSGRLEVYLDSYPRTGQQIKVSAGGGIHPVWRGDGSELYYWHDDELVAVKFDAKWGAGRPKLGAQTLLFKAPYRGASLNTMYDVSADGQRFVIVRER
ncbi:MAG: protein kinase [bacterium]